VLVAVLAVLLAAALGALAVVVRQLVATRRRLEAVLAEQRAPRPPKPVQFAGRAMKVVLDTASRVREGGVSELVMSSMQDFTRWAVEDRAGIVETAAPDGTVTVLFSDIEDSTALNEQLGDAGWIKLLEAHNRVVRAQVEAHDGHVVKTQGDGFMVVFGDPFEAVGAAVGIQADLRRARGRRLRATPLKVRIGLHLGAVTSREGDFLGRNVAMAARVAAQAGGGQILVSDAVHDALADAEGLRFDPYGEVELKGLAGVHRLWCVESA
jgi:class 3 adenylate cyclase